MSPIPFQCLQRCGDFIYAASGSSIHTFNVDGTHVSSWQHPAVNSTSEVEQPKPDQAPEESTPPAKRRKVEVSETREGDTNKSDEKDVSTPDTNGGSASNKTLKPRQAISTIPEFPFVNLMVSTASGSHLIAVTGQDKAIWVFKHDGKGHLEPLSQRAMPKRPSSITLSQDGATIISADKFGDVYSVPLIPTPIAETSTPGTPSGKSTPSRTSTPTPAQPVQRAVQANHLTVHSQRNLKALEHQLKHQNDKKETSKTDGPTFEHTLLLGHVSMLTAVAVATRDGKPYILTADRDEHIRISRGIPQTHVIENYCLGHDSFVTSLCIPASQPDLLVSGGGDSELFVWDWYAGKLLSKTDLLGHVRDIDSGASKVAITRLYDVSSWGQPGVAVIGERVPAVFFFGFDGNILKYKSTARLSGNPLDVALVGGSKLLVGMDVQQMNEKINEKSNTSLVVIGLQEGQWIEQAKTFDAVPTVDLPREQLNKALYTNEILRKTEHEDAQEG